MIGVAALERMSDEALVTWLSARMRGDEEDPPLSTVVLETPGDFVCVARSESDDGAFRERLDRAAVRALREAAQGDLREGPGVRAARALAFLVDGLDLHEAVPVLRAIAERGAFGGKEGLAEDVESAVLPALAGLQSPLELWEDWLRLWRRGPSRLWPAAMTGMRRSRPGLAILFLPEAVKRSTLEGFPLGQILWAFGKDPGVAQGAVAAQLRPLRNSAREGCRAALRKIGAEEDEISAWVPSAPKLPVSAHDIGPAALAGDHAAVVKAAEMIGQQMERVRRGAPLQPRSLQQVYDAVERGVRKCAQSYLHRSPPSTDVRVHVERIVARAVSSWFLADPKEIPRWLPDDAPDLAAFVEIHAGPHVIESMDQH